MDFKQGLHLSARLEQKLVMTQQLQQAIRLLQLSRTELLETVRDSLNENPMLEEVVARSDAQTSSEVTSGEGEVTTLDAAARPERTSAEMDWQEYFADLARGPTAGPSGFASRDDELPPLSATLTREASLPERILEQLGEQDLPSGQRAVAIAIAHGLDDDGYFRPSVLVLHGGADAARRALRRKAEASGLRPIEHADAITLQWLTDAEAERLQTEAMAQKLKSEWTPGNSLRALAQEHGVSWTDAEQALERIKRCEPTGVAAACLRECLLLQARARFPHEERLHRLVERHLENLEARKIGHIQRDLRCTEEEVRRLLGLIRTLDPRPGRGGDDEHTRYITPDVYVTKIGDEYQVTVNDDGLPRLRVSAVYQRALAEGALGGGREDEQQAREYVQEKLRQASWMIRSIEQRQTTIQRVTASIMRFQRAFLDHGIAHLRPLVLREVAEDVQLHESTVSRVTTNKYVHTPQGIFELKFFFNARIAAESGGTDLAAEAVRHAIKRLIDHEPPRSPLSDQEIVEILQGAWDQGRLLARLACSDAEVGALMPEQSLSIARRTVAKYREAMNIPSSSGRRAIV